LSEFTKFISNLKSFCQVKLIIGNIYANKVKILKITTSKKTNKFSYLIDDVHIIYNSKKSKS